MEDYEKKLAKREKKIKIYEDKFQEIMSMDISDEEKDDMVMEMLAKQDLHLHLENEDETDENAVVLDDEFEN